MHELLWLLLPVAAAMGWWSGYRYKRNQVAGKNGGLRENYIKGLNYLLNEQPDKALDLFVRMVEVDSETVDTHLLLGSLFRKRGEVERAIRIHQNLIARPHLEGFHRATALLELGKDYVYAGLLDRAEGLYKELIETGFHRTETSLELQKIYEREKDWDNAIKYAEAASEGSGEGAARVIAHYWCESAEKQRKLGRGRLALSYAKHALSRDPGNVRASILLGDLALEDRDYRAAGKYYARVLEQDSDYLPIVLPKLSEVYRASNDIKGFVKFLKRVDVRDLNGEAVIYLGRLLSEKGDEPEARKVLEDAIQQQPARIRLLREYVALEQRKYSGDAGHMFNLVVRVLDEYLAQWFGYRCVTCGFRSRGMFWLCPSCHSWGTIKPYSSPDDQLGMH